MNIIIKRMETDEEIKGKSSLPIMSRQKATSSFVNAMCRRLVINAL